MKYFIALISIYLRFQSRALDEALCNNSQQQFRAINLYLSQRAKAA